MMKRTLRMMPGVLAGACLALGAGLAGAQNKAANQTPPQAYPKGQAVGAEGKPLTPEQCREHMAMAKDGKVSNDAAMKRRGEQCAELLAASQKPAVQMPGERSSQETPPQAYPQGHAQGAEGKTTGATASSLGMSRDAKSNNTETPPQAYPKGQTAGAMGNSPAKQ